MKIGAIICGYDKTVNNIGKLAETLKGAGIYTVIGYDAQDAMPDTETVNSCDLFFTGGGHSGQRSGELKSLKIGIEILAGNYCEYTLKLTGDVTLSNPKKIADLVMELNGSDVITNQWNDIRGTMVFFGRTDKLKKVILDIPEGWPQLEKKFEKALIRNRVQCEIRECRKDNRGIWATIGYERGSGNYPE
jgi:hypothetical protein